jgi:hypothetical protein
MSRRKAASSLDIVLVLFNECFCARSNHWALSMQFGRPIFGGRIRTGVVRIRCIQRSSLFAKLHGASFSLLSFWRRATIATLCAWVSLCTNAPASRAQDVDFTPYTRAADYCRSNVARPIALSVDRRVLCFDGYVSRRADLALVSKLEQGGLFVVRSYGGEDLITMEMADLLRARNAIVIVYDYCLSACASYLLIASSEAFVLKGALVAWRPVGYGPGDCIGFVEAKDKELPRLDVGKCPSGLIATREVGKLYRLKEKFLETRRASPLFEDPPQSVLTRRALLRLFDEQQNPLVMWTWNPRYSASFVKTKIVYEAYPESQEEIDAIASRLHLVYHVIYDP